MCEKTSPLPCPLCDELPRVGGFELMTGRTGWTCLCPTGCHETDCYMSRDAAIGAWNAWAAETERDLWGE